MNINIKDKDISLKYGFRALMCYEQINGETFAAHNISDIITFFYCIVMTSEKGINLSYDEFIDWLDENPQQLNIFSEWLNEISQRNASLYPSDDTEKKDKGGKKKSKK